MGANGHAATGAAAAAAVLIAVRYKLEGVLLLVAGRVADCI
jgi:hypothetical protein